VSHLKWKTACLAKTATSAGSSFAYNPVVDDDGAVVRWFATATDIEERKQAEDRMRNETVALRETIVRSSMLEEIVGSSPALAAS